MTTRTATTNGTLFIVATPIGNKEDISLRALKILESVNFILAEDTRHSRPLLQNYGIKKPLVSFHAYNEEQKSNNIIARLKDGENVALISDAGTPLISDPGFPLVRLARLHDIKVVPIPGACAITSALSASGIPCDSFTFNGFLPVKESKRREKLQQLSSILHTLVFYESSHRILDALKDIAFVFGEETKIVLAKELTKTYEQFIEASSNDIQKWLNDDKARIKGEFVLIIPPRSLKARNNTALLKILLDELPLKQAVKIAHKITHENKNKLYKDALEL